MEQKIPTLMISKINKVLEEYIDDEMVSNVEHNKNSVEFIVDLFEDTGEFKVVYDWKLKELVYKKHLKKNVTFDVFQKELRNFESMRLKFLDSIETPGTMIETPGAMIDDIFLDEEVSKISQDALVVWSLFGSKILTLIEESNMVLFNIPTTHVDSKMMKYYQDQKVVSGLRVQMDGYYVDSKIVPKVLKTSDSNSLTDQIHNIMLSWVPKRWKAMNQSRFWDFVPSLNAFHDIPGNHYEKMIKSNAKKCPAYAVALVLFRNKFSIERSIEELINYGLIHESPKLAGHCNFLVEFISYVLLRLPHLKYHCCICDEEMEDSVSKQIAKPKICTKFKCQFAFVELRICHNLDLYISPTTVSQDIFHNPDEVDLLISMCYNAAASDRNHIICDPFPEKFVNFGTKRFERLLQVLEGLPPVADLLKHCKEEGSLIKFLDGDQYYLLSWILRTKRCVMVRMPKENLLPMDTTYQYTILVDSPEKTKEFSMNRKKHGSYYAFHGSGLSNWHSILRNGLKNASGTNLQTTGAAYGAGIYMADNFGTSFSYARGEQTWKKSKFGSSVVRGIGVCEVVKLKNVPVTPNPYYVVPNEKAVRIFVITFYCDNCSSNVTIKNIESKLKDYIKREY